MTRKRFHLLLIVFGLLFLLNPINASSLESGHAYVIEGVEGSRHNLVAPGEKSENACIVCHTGDSGRDTLKVSELAEKSESSGNRNDSNEDSSGGVHQSPLWNRGEMPGAGYRAIQAAPLGEHPYNHPTGSSLICLSCHDGALGGDMHGINVDNPRIGASAEPAWNGMAGPLGAPPLSRVDHPISIIYPRGVDGLFVPHNATVTRSRYWALPDYRAEGLKLPTSGTSSYLDLPKEKVSDDAHLSTLVRTTGGLMECDSCHNPHSEKVRPFLRVPSKTLCLVCHDR